MVAPLDVHVQLWYDDMWNDITGDVRGAPSDGGIDIDWGQSSESGEVEPGSVTMQVNNCDGRYTPRLPSSPLYGKIGRNTPLRIYVDYDPPQIVGTSTGLSGDDEYEVTVSAPAGTQVGDMLIAFQSFQNPLTDIRNMVSPVGGGQWELVNVALLQGTDKGGVAWSKLVGRDEPASYNFYFPAGTGPRGIVGIIAIRGVDTGHLFEAQSRAVGLGGSGTTVDITAPIDTTESPLGNDPIEIYWAAGETVSGATTWTSEGGVGLTEQVDVNNAGELTATMATRISSPSDTYTFTASGTLTNRHGLSVVLSSRSHRFYGEVSEWPPRGSCNDGELWVPLTASGFLRRLSRGRVESSAIRAFYERNQENPALAVSAYWPMEDGPEANEFGSIVPGVNPLIHRGDVEFSSFSGFFGSESVATAAEGTFFGGKFNHVHASAATTASVLMAFEDTPPDNNTTLLQLNTRGQVSALRVLHTGTFLLNVQALDNEDNVLDSTGAFNFSSVMTGARTLIVLSGNPVGGNLIVQLDVSEIRDDYTAETLSVADTFNGISMGDSIGVHIGRGMAGVAVGHLAVGNFVLSDATGAAIGYYGEPAVERLRRLCLQAGVSFSAFGSNGKVTGLKQTSSALGEIVSEVMGEEQMGTWISKVEACVQADGGQLFEPRRRGGLFFLDPGPHLGYRARGAMYTQSSAAPLLYDDLGPPFDPVDDDLLTVNDFVANRSQGGLARAVKNEGLLSIQEPPDGVGSYDDSETYDVSSDGQLLPIAQWEVNKGTVVDFRYPRITSPNLAILRCPPTPPLIHYYGGIDAGDRFTVDDLPDWLPKDQVEVLELGLKERLDKYERQLQFNTVPAEPFRVACIGFEANQPVSFNRVGTGGSQVAGGLLLPGVSGSYASTPDTAALDITGDIDIQVEATGDWATVGIPALAAKYNTSGNQRSWRFHLNGSGGLSFTWSTDGSALTTVNSGVPVAASLSGRLAVRVTLNVDDGGNHTVIFYTAPRISGPWTQLASSTSGATTSIFASTSELEVGGFNSGTTDLWTGIIHALEVRNGLGGTVVANPNFSAQLAGTTTFTDSTGKVWTLSGTATIFGSFDAGTDTSLDVVVTQGPLWGETGDVNMNFPFDIMVRGSRLRVTGITTVDPSLRRQLFTVEQTVVNGENQVIEAGEPVQLYRQARIGL